MSLRQVFEVFFDRWGRLVCQYRWQVIVIMVVFALGLGSQVGNIIMDTSFEGYLPKNDPTLKVYEAFRKQFGTEERLVVALKPENVFDLKFLEKLKALHEDLEETVPHIIEVNSLINARHTYGTQDELVVGDLLEDWPETEEDLARFEELVRSNPIYENVLISKDAKFTTIVLDVEANEARGSDLEALEGFEDSAVPEEGTVIGVLNSEQIEELVLTLREVVKRHETPEIEMHIAGGMALSYEMSLSINQDMLWFGIAGNCAVIVLLFILFQARLRGVFLPVAVVSLSIASTGGLMAILGIPLTGTTLILPSFLLAVSIGDSVHILAIYFRAIERGQEGDDAIVHALSHSGMAVFMTSITTAGSLAAFIAADLRPVVDLGIMAPIGVMFAFVYSVVLLPALLAVLPIERLRMLAEGKSMPLLDRFLVGLGRIGTGHPWSVLGVTLILVVIASTGVSKLYFSHDVIPWFPQDMPIIKAYNVMNEDMEGLYSAEFLIKTGHENGLQDPELLVAMDQMKRFAQDLKIGNVSTGKVVSVVDIVKETHQALNENRPEFYAIPDDQSVVAQELLLFENSGSDDLNEVTDPQFQVGRMSLLIPAVDGFGYPPYLDALIENFQGFAGDRAEIGVTGLVALMSRTFLALVTSMAKTYLIAFFVIGLLMVVVIGNFKGGMICMIPNLTPIFLTLGFMGWAGIPLSFATILLGSIAIGISVDDTIHFMHNYRHYYEKSGDAALAVRETMQTTGRALFFTSVVLSVSFFIYMISPMKNMDYFGSLNGIAIILAFIADVVLAPALVTLMARSQWFANAVVSK